MNIECLLFYYAVRGTLPQRCGKAVVCISKLLQSTVSCYVHRLPTRQQCWCSMFLDTIFLIMFNATGNNFKESSMQMQDTIITL